jgi:uncharacterized SAM-binding protein YcdF (DUF218 family)
VSFLGSLTRPLRLVVRWLTAPLRWGLRLLLLLVLGLLAYYVVTLVQVWLTSREYDPVAAQAIVVMGAAQYNGVPSPDLRARLNQALILYEQGYAHLIVTTGSKEPGDVYTEAEAGKTYLESKGVPATDILEAGGRTSWTNLALAATQLKARRDTHVLIVTDPFHEDRSMAIATDVGLDPHPTPTQSSPITGASVIPYFLKTAAGVALGRIVGYQHLHALALLGTAEGRAVLGDDGACADRGAFRATTPVTWQLTRSGVV